MSTENVVAWMIEFNDDEKAVTVREDERDLWIHEGYDVTSLVPQHPTLAPEDVRRIAEKKAGIVCALHGFTGEQKRYIEQMFEAAIIEALGGKGK